MYLWNFLNRHCDKDLHCSAFYILQGTFPANCFILELLASEFSRWKFVVFVSKAFIVGILYQVLLYNRDILSLLYEIVD